MENLKDFMLIFRMEINPNYKPSQDELTQMKTAWGGWIGSIAQKARLVSSHQLGFEGKLISNQKNIDPLSFNNGKSISGNLVLKATDINEATEVAKNCPILVAGGTVEIRSTLTVY